MFIISPPLFTRGKKTELGIAPERKILNLLFSAIQIPQIQISKIDFHQEVFFIATTQPLFFSKLKSETIKEIEKDIIKKESSSFLYTVLWCHFCIIPIIPTPRKAITVYINQVTEAFFFRL